MWDYGEGGEDSNFSLDIDEEVSLFLLAWF